MPTCPSCRRTWISETMQTCIACRKVAKQDASTDWMGVRLRQWAVRNSWTPCVETARRVPGYRDRSPEPAVCLDPGIVEEFE